MLVLFNVGILVLDGVRFGAPLEGQGTNNDAGVCGEGGGDTSYGVVMMGGGRVMLGEGMR